MAPVRARLALALTKRGKAADRGDHLVEPAGKVAAVVNDRLAVAIRQPHRARHLVRTDHVAPPRFFSNAKIAVTSGIILVLPLPVFTTTKNSIA